MLIGGISRSRAAGDEIVAVVRLGVVGRGGNPGVGEPVGWVLGRGGDRCAGELIGGSEVPPATAFAASASNCCDVLPLTWAPIAAVAMRKVSVSRTASLAMSSRAKGLVSAALAAPAKRIRRAASERRA